MLITRYQSLRLELHQLWRNISFKTYYLYFPRSALMRLEDLEHVEYRTFTDAVDHGYMHRPTLQKTTLVNLIKVLPNLPSHKDLAYRNTKDALSIYDDIQRFISLWLDIILEVPEFSHPPIKDLYAIEEVAKWAFTQYKIETIKDDRRKGKLELNEEFPLLQFLAVAGGGLNTNTDDISFVSHLDDRLPNHLKPKPVNEIDQILGWTDPSLYN